MSELKVTQEILAERIGMSQGGVGHWLNKRRQPRIQEMNRVLQALGMDYLEVAMVIREPQISQDEEISLAQKVQPVLSLPGQ